jgi:hypothetical protein
LDSGFGLMLVPLWLDATDLTARATLVEGYNDNVVQVQPAPGAPVERRGSPFTGAELMLRRADRGATSERTLTLDLRGEHYTPLGAPVGGDDGSASLGWRSTTQAGKSTQLSFGQTFMLADQNSTRLSDSPLLGLDPAIGRRLFLLSATDASLMEELDDRHHVRTTLGVDAMDVLHDESVLASTGIDYVSPRVEEGYGMVLGPHDGLETVAMLRYFYVPHALVDISTGERAPRSSWQAQPIAIWSHQISPSWSSTVMGGASASTSPTADGRVLVSPTAGLMTIYAQQDALFLASYSFGYTTVSPLLGPGYSHSAGAQYVGTLVRDGQRQQLALQLDASGGLSTVPISEGAAFALTTGAVGVSLRCALSSWLGLLFGYEGRYARIAQTGAVTATTTVIRDIVFAGLSGTFATNPDEGLLEQPKTRPRAF